MTQDNATSPDFAEVTDPEELAEIAPIDPSPQVVTEYEKLVEANAPQGADEPSPEDDLG